MRKNEVGINNMNEVVFHNVVIGELGRLAVEFVWQTSRLMRRSIVTVSIEPMDGEGEAWTVDDASGFFFSGQLYVGEYSVTFEKTFTSQLLSPPRWRLSETHRLPMRALACVT